jgi:hypothetical protein
VSVQMCLSPEPLVASLMWTFVGSFVVAAVMAGKC